MKIVTICSTKGGAGKTTLSANIGGIFAELGNNVLLIDADVQPTLSGYFKLKNRSKYGLTELVQTGSVNSDFISTTNIDNLDIVYSNDPNGSLQSWIPSTADGRIRIHRALRSSSLNYDLVIIDTQGAVGALQDAAILAADLLVSPVPPEILSAKEFIRGTLRVIEGVSGFEFLGLKIAPLKAIIYKMDNTNDSKIVKKVLIEEISKLKKNISLFNTVIPQRVAFREAATSKIPVHMWENNHTKSSASTEAMFSLAAEMLEFLENNGES